MITSSDDRAELRLLLDDADGEYELLVGGVPVEFPRLGELLDDADMCEQLEVFAECDSLNETRLGLENSAMSAEVDRMRACIARAMFALNKGGSAAQTVAMNALRRAITREEK